MNAIAAAAVTLVAVLHLFFLVLEMFLWQTRYGMDTFGTDPDFAKASSVVAANQGLYNGFLAAGLLWTLVSYGVIGGRPILTFFLLCVLVAGIYGGATVKPSIYFIQAAPALAALALVWASRG